MLEIKKQNRRNKTEEIRSTETEAKHIYQLFSTKQDIYKRIFPYEWQAKTKLFALNAK